jgi:deazaflavin-dependent oxidoreductase (nitroreductase family)
MTTGTTKGTKPSGITRLFFRFPIWLYRLHLGWLLGDRFLMFEHTGRKSGLTRYAVVEVVWHDPSTDSYYIASGWGEKADWFQNIQQDPQVMLHTGRRHMPATAVHLSVDDATAVLLNYATRHPVAFKNLSKLMVGRTLEACESDCRLLAESVPMVRLNPQSKSTG